MGHYWDITRPLSAFRESFHPFPWRTVATPVLRRQIKYTYHIRALHLVIHKSGKNSDSGQNWVETLTAIVWSVCMLPEFRVWSLVSRLEFSPPPPRDRDQYPISHWYGYHQRSFHTPVNIGCSHYSCSVLQHVCLVLKMWDYHIHIT